MITYDRTATYGPMLERALDVLHPRLRLSLDRRDTRIIMVPQSTSFLAATGDRKAAQLDRADCRGVVYGAYAYKANLLVLRPFTRDIIQRDIAVYLAHEAGHVLDVERGEGAYASRTDEFLRERFRAARADGYAISQYSKVSRQELVAEYIRALSGFSYDPDANDRERAGQIDPDLATYLDAWLGT
jgi:hypothetical protein